MKFFFSLLTIFIYGILSIGCNRENKQYHGYKFLKDKQLIDIHDISNYDVKSNIVLQKNELTGRLESKINLEFFNYGEDIRLHPMCSDDNFYAFMATYTHYYIVSAGQIEITKITNNKNYGEWGIANVNISNSNKYFTNVFISPLALEKIKYNNETSNLLLAKFMCLETNSFFTGVFLCDNTTSYIVSYEYNKIMTYSPWAQFTDYNRKFREELMPKDIHDKYLEKQKYVDTGLVDKSILNFVNKYIVK